MLSSIVAGSGRISPCDLISVKVVPGESDKTSCIQVNCNLQPLAASIETVANAPRQLLQTTVAAIMGEKNKVADGITDELAELNVSPEELNSLLDRAMSRDSWTNFARYALRDGFPSGLVTLALNLWGFKGFTQLTGDSAAAAALYGATLGSAIVVLDEIFRHMFEGMTYTPAELASAVPAVPYFAATTLPLTVRNVVRAVTHVSLVLAGRPDLVANIDNAIEIIGGMAATIVTGYASAHFSLPEGHERQRGILIRKDLPSLIGQLREGHATHVGRVARQAGWAALCAVLGILPGLRKLATPVGIGTVATLTAFVPAAVKSMDAIQAAIDDDTRGIPEGSAELARVGILFSAYLLLAAGARYADPAFGKVGAALKRVGSACVTAASRTTINQFTPRPRWY